MSFKRLQFAGSTWLLLLLLTVAGQAQFDFSIDDDTVSITKYTGLGGSVIIPDKIKDLPVVNIDMSAFDYCTNLTSITIANSVTTIEDHAFEGHSSLTNVSIGNGVTSIGDSAFKQCDHLSTVTLGSGVVKIRDFAFDSCTSLSTITIPDGVTNLGESAFDGCTALVSVTLGKRLANIEDSAFSGCTSLRQIYYQGDAPKVGCCQFFENATNYYLPGNRGWDATFCSRPVVLWNKP